MAVLCFQVFDAAINGLLHHPDWSEWSEKQLTRHVYPAADAQHVVEQYKQYQARLSQRQQQAAGLAAQQVAAGEPRSGSDSRAVATE